MDAPPSNKRLASLLNEIADLMEIDEADAFRIRSYRNAAQVIQSHPESLAELAADPRRELTEVKGVGKGLRSILEELIARGTCARREELLAKYPPVALDLLRIGGLGPKTIALIHRHFPLQNLDDLERLAREGKLRALPRLGEKFEQKLLRGLEGARRQQGRFLRNIVERAAEELKADLEALPGVERVEAAGSLRRGRETIGDLDLVVAGPAAAEALDRAATLPTVTETLARGDRKVSVRLGRRGLQADLRAVDSDSFGAAWQYFTGGKEHNVALRSRAVARGWRLNEYGLFRAEDGDRIASASEEEIYAAFGLPWIPPELREGIGEIEAAERGALPRLIELEDLRGDVHMHTVATDGRFTIEQMARAAQERGLRYIAITDHSKAIAMANGLDERRLAEQVREVRDLDRRLDGIRILAGCEVDILRDGRLDLADDALAELDVVIGSVHSQLDLESETMTERLLRAIENPRLDILGHPTGRRLLRREASSFDFERVAAAAVAAGVALEINSSPERLDLGAVEIRRARALGARFVISSDAHHVRNFELLRHGVVTARRGWLSPEDVLNTLDEGEFLKALRRNRR